MSETKLKSSSGESSM